MAPVFVKRFYINKHIGMEGFYSFIIDDNVDEPNEKIIYGDGCRGYTPAKMNFNTKKFEYGSWADAFFMNVKPCMLNYGGTVAYYLDENNYELKEDGSASDNKNLNFGGNAMVEFPKIFLKVEDLGNKRGRVTISKEKAGEDSECWSNIDENNNEINHYYMAIYPAAVYNGLSRSISGSSVYYSNYSVLCNHGYTEKINETVGKKQWSGFIRSDFQILRFLLMLITKTTDISGAIGYGNCFNDTLLTPGSMDKKGLFYGENTGMSGVKAFGIENLWGNAGTAIYGQFCSVSSTGAKYYVKMTKGKYDGSNIIGYSTGKHQFTTFEYF